MNKSLIAGFAFGFMFASILFVNNPELQFKNAYALNDSIGPNTVIPDRYIYYPGTEVLAKNEVRVTACGTGMPDQRISQASSCWLFEFGNGEKS